MSWQDSLITNVGGAVAKFLLKYWLGSTADIAGSFVDLAKEKFNDAAKQREAERRFGEWGDKVAAKLVPLFEKEIQRGEVIVDNVIPELEITLLGKISAEFFLTRDLNPEALTTALLMEKRSLAPLSQAEWDFHDRALTEVVRYVVGAASALPKFEEKLAGELLARLSRIGGDLATVLESTQRIEQHVIGVTGEKAARYEADYRAAVIRKLDYLELFGADIPPEARSHALSVAYVSLNLQRTGNDDDESSSLPVEEVLDQLGPDSGRMLIFGEAGSGKSTLFRWAAIKAAELNVTAVTFHRGFVKGVDYEFSIRFDRDERRKDKLPPDSWIGPDGEPDGNCDSWWDYHIPFLIRLRDFTDGHLPSPERFPELIAKEIGGPPADWVQQILKAGRALVLLDGVDEIPGMKRDVLRAEIKAITDTFPKNYFLVSTRPQAVDKGWLAGEGFREATVNPMNDRDKAILIDKWHLAVGQELRRRGEHDPNLEGMAERLKTKLRKTPSINLLAKYPLLAAMICAFHRQNDERLPVSEVELIERLCFMLLHDRDEGRELLKKATPDDYSQLDYRPKKLIVQDLAYHMMVHKGESSLSKEEALNQVRERLPRLGKSTADPRVILKALVERSGMLREPVPDRIGFLHNAFKEYLTALRLVEENADGLLAGHWADAEWLPVILFAAATEKQRFATGLIKKLLTVGFVSKLLGSDPMEPVKVATRTTKPSQADKEIRQRQVLALRCRRVAMDIDPDLQSQLDKQRVALFPPQTFTDAEALSAAGDLAVDELQYDTNQPVKVRAACVRALRLINSPKSRHILLGYLPDEHQSVIEELANAVDPLMIPVVLNWIHQSWSTGLKEDQKSVRRLITDAGRLSTQTSCELIDLDGTGVADLSPLAELTALKDLNLRGTQIKDISPLSQLTELRNLDISGTRVVDLAPIVTLPQLFILRVGDGAFTEKQLADFAVTRKTGGLPVVDILGTTKEVHQRRLDEQRKKWEQEQQQKRNEEAEKERERERIEMRAMRCFVNGTLVHTNAGLQPIEAIEIGTLVLSWNEQDRCFEYTTVTRTINGGRRDLVKLSGNGWTLTCSANHPFLVADGHWLPANALKVGKRLFARDESFIDLTHVEILDSSSDISVFNIEVEPNHTYCVESVGLVVHNMKTG